jgi:AbrB family looped-hinge helix DNA binding protein
MISTIDKAGRVVIPAAIRERLRLDPGTVLDISVDDTGLRLERVGAAPTVRQRGKRLVAQPSASGPRPVVDIAALVEEERSRWP